MYINKPLLLLYASVAYGIDPQITNVMDSNTAGTVAFSCCF